MSDKLWKHNTYMVASLALLTMRDNSDSCLCFVFLQDIYVEISPIWSAILQFMTEVNYARRQASRRIAQRTRLTIGLQHFYGLSAYFVFFCRVNVKNKVFQTAQLAYIMNTDGLNIWRCLYRNMFGTIYKICDQKIFPNRLQ